MHVAPDVMARQVGEDTVLLHLGTGTYYGLDAVGSRVWQLIAQGCELPEIHQQLLDEYEVAPEVLARDLDALIGELFERRLLLP